MNTAQTTIIWLGLALIVMNIIKNWAEVKQTVFTSPATTTAVLTAANTANTTTQSPVSNTPTNSNAQTTPSAVLA